VPDYTGEIAGGLRARRGSSPFPGAINIILKNHPSSKEQPLENGLLLFNQLLN
jgi:hypothetical protein